MNRQNDRQTQTQTQTQTSKNIFSILQFTFALPLLGCKYYNMTSMSWIGFYGMTIYLLYNCVYKLAFHNRLFAMLITPIRYVESFDGCHKLVAYSASTIHAIMISIASSLYIYEWISEYYYINILVLSMAYYLADCVYVIDSSKLIYTRLNLQFKLHINDYLVLLHHSIIIYYQIFLFRQDRGDSNGNGNGNGNENVNYTKYALFYLSRMLIAEYTVVPLNYTWYLLHTNQTHTLQMKLSSIITLVMYFLTRIVNFTYMFFLLYNDGVMLTAMISLPLFILNYYWFCKLIMKAICIMI